MLHNIIDVPWTLTLDNAHKQALFWVIHNVWAKQEDGLVVMTVWAMNNFGRGHVGLNRHEDLLQ